LFETCFGWNFNAIAALAAREEEEGGGGGGMHEVQFLNTGHNTSISNLVLLIFRTNEYVNF
jgi:hypothetical protein